MKAKKSTKKKAKVPKKLQSILWSTPVNMLDLERDKGYVIHQTLIYGSFSELKWLFDTYSKKDIINVFLNVPYKNYPDYVFNFVKNHILNLKKSRLDEKSYVTQISGQVRPRAAKNIL